jgi:hypothetical protein
MLSLLVHHVNSRFLKVNGRNRTKNKIEIKEQNGKSSRRLENNENFNT